jgi:uncharacterized protein
MSEKTPNFDPNWEPVYRTSTRQMGYNVYATNQQVDHTSDQVQAMTAIINAYEQRLHELEARLEAVEITERVLENTSPSEKRGPGRPRKEEASA